MSGHVWSYQEGEPLTACVCDITAVRDTACCSSQSIRRTSNLPVANRRPCWSTQLPFYSVSWTKFYRCQTNRSTVSGPRL